MEQFTLVNKLRNRINVFKPFKSSLKQAQEMIEIEYGCVYKRISKPVMKGSRIEPIEKLEKNTKNYQKRVGRKLLYIISTFRHLKCNLGDFSYS